MAGTGVARRVIFFIPAQVSEAITGGRVSTAGPSSGTSATPSVAGNRPSAQTTSTNTSSASHRRIGALSHTAGTAGTVVPDQLSAFPSNPSNPSYRLQPPNATTRPIQGNPPSASPGNRQGNSHLFNPEYQSSLYDHFPRENGAGDSL